MCLLGRHKGILSMLGERQTLKNMVSTEIIKYLHKVFACLVQEHLSMNFCAIKTRFLGVFFGGVSYTFGYSFYQVIIKESVCIKGALCSLGEDILIIFLTY